MNLEEGANLAVELFPTSVEGMSEGFLCLSGPPVVSPREFSSSSCPFLGGGLGTDILFAVRTLCTWRLYLGRSGRDSLDEGVQQQVRPPVQAAHKHLERLASAHTHLVLMAAVPLEELKVLPTVLRLVMREQ